LGSGPVICSLGSLAADGSVTITVKARATAPGQAVNSVTISTATPESVTTNNAATATVHVQGPFTPPAAVCARLEAPHLRLLANETRTFGVRVTDRSGKPVANARVRALGAGVSLVRRTSATGVVRFHVKPRAAGALEVTLLQSQACGQQLAAFEVLAATASLPTFAG
jgi:hypothetical protein